MRIFIQFIFLGLIIQSCSTDVEPGVLSSQLEDEMNFEVAEDVVIWYTDSALLKAKISGKILRRFIDRVKPFDEFSEGVIVDFYDQDGQKESQMLADYAIRYDKDEIIVARDPNGVVLSNEKGDTLISTEVIWNSKDDRIYTDRFVKIVTPDRIIWGQGFESNNDFSRGRIKAVEGELVVDNIVGEEG